MKIRSLLKLFNAEIEIEGRIKVYRDFIEFLKSRKTENKKITKAQARVHSFMKKWILDYVGWHSSNGRVFSDEVVKFVFEMMFPTKDVIQDVYLNGLHPDS